MTRLGLCSMSRFKSLKISRAAEAAAAAAAATGTANLKPDPSHPSKSCRTPVPCFLLPPSLQVCRWADKAGERWCRHEHVHLEQGPFRSCEKKRELRRRTHNKSPDIKSLQQGRFDELGVYIARPRQLRTHKKTRSSSGWDFLSGWRNC